MDGEITWDNKHEPEGYPPGSVKLIYYYPKVGEITVAQLKYLNGYIDAFEDIIFANNYADTI
jgi:hypothetical protein